MDSKVKKLLEKNKIKYKLLPHRKVYTAFTEAETQHVDPKAVVKTVFLKLSKPSTHVLQNGRIAQLDSILVAIPAKKRVSFKKVAKAINDHAMKSHKQMVRNAGLRRGVTSKGRAGVRPYKKPSKIRVKMANEQDIAKKLKTKVGLLSAFSQIYGLPLLMDKALAKNKKLTLAAGSYTESLEISTKVFLKIMVGMTGSFAE